MLLISKPVKSESSIESVFGFFLWDLPIFYGLLVIAIFAGLIALINLGRSQSKGSKNEETKTSTTLSVIKFLLYLIFIAVIGIMALYFGIYLLLT